MYGVKVESAMVASAGTFTNGVNIQGFRHIAFELQTLDVGLNTASASVYAQVRNSSDGTWRRVRAMGVYSGVSGIEEWNVPEGLGNCYVICRPAAEYDYVRLEYASTNSTALTNFTAYVHMHQPNA